MHDTRTRLVDRSSRGGGITAAFITQTNYMDQLPELLGNGDIFMKHTCSAPLHMANHDLATVLTIENL
jgi:hypothetical protein